MKLQFNFEIYIRMWQKIIGLAKSQTPSILYILGNKDCH